MIQEDGSNYVFRNLKVFLRQKHVYRLMYINIKIDKKKSFDVTSSI